MHEGRLATGVETHDALQEGEGKRQWGESARSSSGHGRETTRVHLRDASLERHDSKSILDC